MRLLAGYAAAFLFAWLLTGQVKPEATILAATLGVVACAWWRLVRSGSRRTISWPTGGQGRAWLRAVAAIPGDTVRVGTAMAAALVGTPSRFRAPDAPFRFGPEDDKHEAGRRAVAIVAGSLSPDRIVVDVSPHEAVARTHRLRGGEAGSAEWLA